MKNNLKDLLEKSIKIASDIFYLILGIVVIAIIFITILSPILLVVTLIMALASTHIPVWIFVTLGFLSIISIIISVNISLEGKPLPQVDEDVPYFVEGNNNDYFTNEYEIGGKDNK